MTEGQTKNNRTISADWLVRGVLTRLGDTFDRLTGRSWKPSSSLATSELAEKLKSMIDADARETDGRKYVPHNIKLRIQWDKFSTDAEDSLKKLEDELLTALVDHINDRRYYTHAPISLTVKPDYFTDGVKLTASFDNVLVDESERTVDVAVPDSRTGGELEQIQATGSGGEAALTVRFSVNGKPGVKTFRLRPGDRVSVGRTKESGLWIDDASISKSHASLALNASGGLMVADTGSTNGTFVDDARIAYGKAVGITPANRLKFGSVDLLLELEIIESPVPVAGTDDKKADKDKEPVYSVGEFEFKQKTSASDDEFKTIPNAVETSKTTSVILTPISHNAGLVQDTEDKEKV